jgi:molybdate transport repressor ModE-like protein
MSLLYATTGQAGGTAFLAVMTFETFPPSQMRPTALLLNVVAAGYSTWRQHRRGAIEWDLMIPLTVQSLVTAFLGGQLVVRGPVYSLCTGVLLFAAGALLFWRPSRLADEHQPAWLPIAIVGSVAGLLSGLTGVGGGVFIVPPLVALGWTSARRAAAISPPFILCNSAIGFAGVLLSGQQVAAGKPYYAGAALVGAIAGTAVGLRWLSELSTRRVLGGIPLIAGGAFFFSALSLRGRFAHGRENQHAIDFPTGPIGPGKIQLLELIDEHGSISAAGRAMEMSYRRAWMLINDLNSMSKIPLLVAAQTGGSRSGGAALTSSGSGLLSSFRKFETHAARDQATLYKLSALLRP